MESFFSQFRLNDEKEKLETVVQTIDNGVVFRGTNLWVLIFAIFVASLGLNLNSPAVIIGAMLISPLMGPIMGIGLGVGMNDIVLLRKSLKNYFRASIVALTTSTIFFLISPLNEAHSEILARTAPTIYDVLIALFGGLAGILAVYSKHKGNVLPGVAIATALMPPLCTAGYGLATLQMKFFYGAIYLFIINTVFIALATFILTRILHFPYRHLANRRADIIARRVVWIVVIATLVPSIYFGYDMVQRTQFTQKANRFIINEAHFKNDYLLSKKIDAKTKSILLVFGGKQLEKEEIEKLRSLLKKYGLEDAHLEIKQGFAYLAEDPSKQNDLLMQATLAIAEKENALSLLQAGSDSLKAAEVLSRQVFDELKIQYPSITEAIIQPSVIHKPNASAQKTYLVMLSGTRGIFAKDKSRIGAWLKTRLQVAEITLVFN